MLTGRTQQRGNVDYVGRKAEMAFTGVGQAVEPEGRGCPQIRSG